MGLIGRSTVDLVGVGVLVTTGTITGDFVVNLDGLGGITGGVGFFGIGGGDTGGFTGGGVGVGSTGAGALSSGTIGVITGVDGGTNKCGLISVRSFW